MNKELIISPKIDTPRINFNAESGVLHIEGKSFPPDVTATFGGVMRWIDAYVQQPSKLTTLVLKLDYFNTASSKIIMDILYRMEELNNAGYEVLIKWFYPEDDEDMMETGKEYAEIINVPFEHIGYTFLID